MNSPPGALTRPMIGESERVDSREILNTLAEVIGYLFVVIFVHDPMALFETHLAVMHLYLLVEKTAAGQVIKIIGVTVRYRVVSAVKR